MCAAYSRTEKKRMRQSTFITNSKQETAKLGEKIAKTVQKGTVLCLYGELGAGKTTFVQGLAKGLGVSQRIISPTFVIAREYRAGDDNFYHIDLYRVQNSSELKELGLTEVVNNPENIVAIEWAERMGELLPERRWDFFLEQKTEETREIRVTQH